MFSLYRGGGGGMGKGQEGRKGAGRGVNGGERKGEAFILLVCHVTLMHVGNWDCRSETKGTVEAL